MLVEALEARLRVLEDEILRLTRLASQSSSQAEQDRQLLLVRDLQHEARELRSQIRRISEQVPAAHLSNFKV